MRLGYCNCLIVERKYKDNRESIAQGNVGYIKRRVDDNDLCFMCGHTAMKSRPERNERCSYKKVDTTVSLDNPEGIWTVSKSI